MSRRQILRISLPIVAGLLLFCVGLWHWGGSAGGRAENAMRKAFTRGWAGTNEAHCIVLDLPAPEALRVLANLLRSPEPKYFALYRRAKAILPEPIMRQIAPPGRPGPVEFCAYQWMAEALGRTNVTVDPLLPLLEEKPRLFWNIIPGPLIAHLKTHQDEVEKLLPFLRHKDIEIVSAAAFLVKASDGNGVSEPDFRRLVATVPAERLEQMTSGLLTVTRNAEGTADWLWSEVANAPTNRVAALTTAIQQLEPRIRREAGFLRMRLESTNAAVRIAGLRVAANHPARAAPVFDRIDELSRSSDAYERELAAQACVLVAVSPKRELAMRIAAARIVARSGDPEAMGALRRAAIGQQLPDEVEAALAFTGR